MLPEHTSDYPRLLRRQIKKHTCQDGSIDIDTLLSTIAASYKEQHKCRERLERNLTLMSDEMHEQNRQLARIGEEAISLSKLKTEFLANISHELRTPMHAIMSYATLGINKMHQWDQDKQRNNIKKILTSGERLLGLLNNLLDLSKMESGSQEYTIREHDMLEIIHAVVDEAEPLAVAKSLHIDISSEGSQSTALQCDRGRIFQCILNLLSNAIKFTPEHKSIRIICSHNNEYVHVCVEDEGFGIPEHELGKIFDKFTQSSNTKNGSGGTGLGLAITKEIIEAHGGYLHVKNNDDSGASFSLSLLKSGPTETPRIALHSGITA